MQKILKNLVLGDPNPEAIAEDSVFLLANQGITDILLKEANEFPERPNYEIDTGESACYDPWLDERERYES